MSRPYQDLSALFVSIGLERDYSDLDLGAVAPDLQGWASDNPCFAELITELRPAVVIEVGTWKGASVVEMGRTAQRLGLATAFICIDTWLGSNPELWLHAELRQSLQVRGGYPAMFRTFIRNLQEVGLTETVFPMPMTSITAATILRHWGVKADLIYIDAGHSQVEVTTDLETYAPLLRPGGLLLGDDYLPQWPGVVAAVDAFSKRHNWQTELRGEKFLFRLPG
jgi:hypothetical protein